MSKRGHRVFLKIVGVFFVLALCVVPRAGAQSLDELHKQALKEGGTLNFYGTLDVSTKD